MSKRIFANLGFLLQISGILTILPIVLGLVYNETQAVVSLLITCVTFLGLGFLLNALCERKSLDFKSANLLFVLAFLILPLVGAIPYIYNNTFNSATIADRFTNGYFESVSGFTTTGFSFVAQPETLPISLLVYRSLTELMGGVGIVFLLLAFFQSKFSLSNLGNSIGIDNVNGNLRKTFLSVFAIYAVFILFFTGLFFALGFHNPISTGTFIIDTLTGGYQPSIQAYQPYLDVVPKTLIILLMFLGSVNFAFNYNLFALKPKKAITPEILVYIGIIIVATVAVAVLTNVNAFDSLFHVVSMSSSTGQSYLPLSAFGETGLSILIVVMVIGGCTFSMAGGIRVSRIVTLGKSVKENVTATLARENFIFRQKRQDEPEGRSLEHLSATITIVLFIFTLVVFAVIFTTMGVSFTDALFEVGSAITTNGISNGATTLSMGIGYKWLMIAAMTIGRVEILTIILALAPVRRTHNRSPDFPKMVEIS